MKLINQILQVNERDIEAVRNIYGKTEESVRDDVQLLKMWMEKQPHLPQNYDENRLERMLLRNKFRMEQCKFKIDSYFTLRGMYPDFFKNININLKGFEQIRKFLIYVPMPCLTDKKERVVIAYYLANSAHLYNSKEQYEYFLALTDLELSHDYAAATIFVVDFKYFSLGHIKNIDLNHAIQGLTLYQTAYSERVTSVEFLNVPKYIDVIMGVLKVAMKSKLYNKIHFHKSVEELHKSVDKKYLPLDYGGEQKSMKEIHGQMGEMWKEEIDFLVENRKLVSNENLRIGEPYKNDLFGVQGTFRKMNLD